MTDVSVLTTNEPRTLEEERRYQAKSFGLSEDAPWSLIQKTVRELPEGGFVNYEDWVHVMRRKGVRLQALV